MTLTKRLILGSFIAPLTFGLGLANYFEFQTIKSHLWPTEDQPVTTVQITPKEEPSEPEYLPVPIIGASSLVTKEQPPGDFDATGEYYAVDETLPKGFEKFEYIELAMRDYSNWTEEEPVGIPIPPKGSIRFGKEFKFRRIAIGGDQIGFETQKIDGISYRFTGKFVHEQSSGDEDVWFDLKGRLIKLKDGKKIAEMELKLYIAGCC